MTLLPLLAILLIGAAYLTVKALGAKDQTDRRFDQ